jgi:hypothetical protein
MLGTAGPGADHTTARRPDEPSAAGDEDVRVLERLVGDLRTFDREHWGSKPLHRSTGGAFDDLIDIEDVERLLLDGARVPTFRLVDAGVPLPPAASTRSVRLGGRQVDDVADPDRIAAAIAEGATLVVQSLHRTCAPLRRLCAQLERATSHPVQANAYLSPPRSAGLAEHADLHDVLVLQVHGSKRWTVDGADPLVTTVGDVLYVPAGSRHRAESLDEPSLHLTIGIIRVTAADVVRRALRKVEAMDATLPLGYARPELRDRLHGVVTDALRDAAGAIADLDVDGVVEVERARASRRRPAADGRLRAALSVDALDLGSRVVRRSEVAAVLELPSGDRVVVELADRRISMPRAMRRAVERLLRPDPVAIRDLDGLDDGSKLVLVRRLVREGLLDVVPGT